MSTLTTRPARSSAHPGPVRVEPVTPARVVRSEWVKFRSLRSTALTLLAGVVVLVAAGWIFGWATRATWSDATAAQHAAFNPVDTTLGGYSLAQLAVGVPGVLLVTGEYATGMVRATFGAVPRRLPVLWAKAALYGAVTLAVMLPAALVAFLGGQQLLGVHGTDLSATGATRALLGVAGYLALIGVFAVALGFLVRSTAGGIAILFALLLVLPTLGLLLPAGWRNVLDYLPSNAGEAMVSTRPLDGLSAPGGLLVLLAWVAVALIAAALLLERRDV